MEEATYIWNHGLIKRRRHSRRSVACTSGTNKRRNALSQLIHHCLQSLSSSQSVSFQMNVTFSPGNKSDLWFIWSTAMLIAEAYNSPRWKELPRRSVRLNGIKRPSLTSSVVGEGECRRNTNHISVASVCMAIGATCCLNPTTTSLNPISSSLRK